MVERVESLKKLLSHKKSRKFYADRLSREYGTTISIDQVNEYFKSINKSLDTPKDKEGIVGVDENIKDGSLKLSFYSDHPATAEEIIASHKLDMKLWKLDRFWSLQKGKGFLTSALFVAIRGEEKATTDFLEFFENYKAPKLEFKVKTNEKFYAPCMAELNICDLHIDKFSAIQNETFDELGEKYFNLIETLLHRAYGSHKIEEIVFVAGNDFFTSDNFQNQVTSQSNVQEINERWDFSYEKGFDLLVRTLSMVRTFAENVKVIVMPGNHPKTKEFYIGHALEVYFRNDKGMTFDRTSKPRKVHKYFDNLTLFHHGNCKLEKLPLIMASEFSKEWGETKYHRCHTSDKHHQFTKEIDGVIIQQFPSLSQTDTWHNENNFHLALRVGMITIYDREKGVIAQLQEKI